MCNTQIGNSMERFLSECRWYTPEGSECVWELDESDVSNQVSSRHVGERRTV